jgi:hypothetical protein
MALPTQDDEPLHIIEDWPAFFRGVPPVETLTSGDGNLRVRFVRRIDGAVQFFEQELRRCETDGQEYFVWYCDHRLSGIYPDLETARCDAGKLVPWLRNKS